MQIRIKNTTALVTGANRGIGKGFVQALLAGGAKRVYAAARRVSDLDSVVALDPKRVVAIQLDVTDPAQAARAAAVATDVNLVINNAGVLFGGSALEASADDLAKTFAVNVSGPLNVTRAFAPVLTRQAGSAVVNLLSVVSFVSAPSLGIYSASKAAAWSITQGLRADLGKKGVKVFGVFPGPVDTDMAKDIPMDKTSPLQVANNVLAGIEAGTEDIFPDPMSTQVYAGWSKDHKAVEKQFAASM